MTEEEKKAAEEKAAKEAKEKAEREAAEKAALEKAEAEAKEKLKAAGLDSDMLERLINNGVAVQLTKIKGSLDKAYGERDSALNRLAEIERAQKAAELKKLEEEGKWREAAAIREKEAKEQLEALQKQNIELSRNAHVRLLLTPLEFRNAKAASTAFSDITSELVQDATGAWKHKDGRTVEQFIEEYQKDPENEFLFKPKSNSGGGSTSKTGGAGQPAAGSLASMSQDDVLKLAREGRLPVRRRR